MEQTERQGRRLQEYRHRT